HLLFGRLVHLAVRHERPAVGFRHRLRQRCRQGRLAVVDVTNRPYVHVRLGACEFLFGHGVIPYLTPTALYSSLMMPWAMLGGTSTYLENSMVKLVRPWLIERTVVAYPNTSDRVPPAGLA